MNSRFGLFPGLLAFGAVNALSFGFEGGEVMCDQRFKKFDKNEEGQIQSDGKPMCPWDNPDVLNVPCDDDRHARKCIKETCCGHTGDEFEADEENIGISQIHGEVTQVRGRGPANDVPGRPEIYINAEDMSKEVATQIKTYDDNAQTCREWHAFQLILAHHDKCGAGQRYNANIAEDMCLDHADCKKKCCLPVAQTCREWHAFQSSLADHDKCGAGQRYNEDIAEDMCLDHADCKKKCCLPVFENQVRRAAIKKKLPEDSSNDNWKKLSFWQKKEPQIYEQWALGLSREWAETKAWLKDPATRPMPMLIYKYVVVGTLQVLGIKDESDEIKEAFFSRFDGFAGIPNWDTVTYLKSVFDQLNPIVAQPRDADISLRIVQFVCSIYHDERVPYEDCQRYVHRREGGVAIVLGPSASGKTYITQNKLMPEFAGDSELRDRFPIEAKNGLVFIVDGGTAREVSQSWQDAVDKAAELQITGFSDLFEQFKFRKFKDLMADLLIRKNIPFLLPETGTNDFYVLSFSNGIYTNPQLIYLRNSKLAMRRIFHRIETTQPTSKLAMRRIFHRIETTQPTFLVVLAMVYSEREVCAHQGASREKTEGKKYSDSSWLGAVKLPFCVVDYLRNSGIQLYPSMFIYKSRDSIADNDIERQATIMKKVPLDKVKAHIQDMLPDESVGLEKLYNPESFLSPDDKTANQAIYHSGFLENMKVLKEEDGASDDDHDSEDGGEMTIRRFDLDF